MNEDGDARDVRASLGGDEDAYARLVRRYEPQIASQMWRFSRDPRVVEELVQEAFVQAYLSLKNFRGEAPFLHWLRRIATRVGYRYWTQRNRRREVERLAGEGELERMPDPDAAAPSDAAAYVHGLLAQLPPRDRLVLTLQYLDECSVEEIAERTGWSRSMVKVQAFRARKKLKKLLDDSA